MHLLITGGAGFIGTNLVHYLMERAAVKRLTVLDRLTYAGRRSNLARWEKDPRFRFVEGDVCDASALDGVLPGVEAVLHLAAETHVDRSILDAAEFLRTNVTGTWNLLEGARRHGVRRILHVSTDEVYGEVERGSRREGDPLRPSNPYSASKAGADLLCLAYHRTHGTPIVIARPSNNFGPFQYPEKLIPFFITRALIGEDLPVYGDGLQVRDWLYVTDHCRALELLLARGKAGEVYNVGAGNYRTNLEIARAILRALGRPESRIRHVEDRPGHDRRYSVDTGRLRSLGWRPEADFEEALERTIRWYVDRADWWGEILAERQDYRQYLACQYGARSTAAQGPVPGRGAGSRPAESQGEP